MKKTKTNKPYVVVISGNKRNGKNTVADYLHNAFTSCGYSVKQLAFADSLRQVSGRLLFLTPSSEWLNSKKDQRMPRLLFLATGRDVLKFIGTIVRSIIPNYWTYKTIDSIEQCSQDIVILTDCRFHNEHHKVLTRYEGMHIRVRNPDIEVSNDLTERLFDCLYTWTVSCRSYKRNLDSKVCLDSVLINNDGNLGQLNDVCYDIAKLLTRRNFKSVSANSLFNVKE